MPRTVAFLWAAGVVACAAGCWVSLDGLTGGACGGSNCPAGTDDAGPSDAAGADTSADTSGGVTDSSAGDDTSVESADTGAPDANDAQSPPPCTPPTSPSLNDCTGLVDMPAPPVIDGVLDCGVPLWPMPIVAWTGPGTLPSTVQATIAAAWRPNGLYFFVNVTGAGSTRYPAPAGTAGEYCGDAVELFVDSTGTYPNAPLYNVPGTIQLIVESAPNQSTPTSIGDRVQNANLVGPWTGSFVSVATSDGFAVEAFVVASDLGLATWALGAGDSVGMDVSVDIGSSTGHPSSCPRIGQFTIQLPQVVDGGCSEASCNVNEFCNPQLD